MELIKIESRELVPGQMVDTVNARDLWAFVESKQKFTDWFYGHLDHYGFLADQDYLIHTHRKQVPHQGGVRNVVMVDYFLTLDTAKEVAMIQNNDRGREVRKYFIECERRAKAAALDAHAATAAAASAPVASPAAPFDPSTVFEDPAAMRGLLLTYTERLIKAEKTVEEQAPKVDALNRIATFLNGSLCITDAAKSLQIQPKELFLWLEANDWIYRRPGTHWKAYQPRLKQGYLEHKVTEIKTRDIDGVPTDKLVDQVRVTPKGLTYLSEVFSRRIKSGTHV